MMKSEQVLELKDHVIRLEKKTRNEENLKRYRSAKKEAKKAVNKATFKVYDDDLYHQLGSRNGEMDVTYTNFLR